MFLALLIPLTVIPAFAQGATYTVMPAAGPNGNISPNSLQTVAAGGSLTFTATPQLSYSVNTWSVDGTVTQNGGLTFKLTNINANHVVLVTFATFTGPGDRCMFHHGAQHTGDSASKGPASASD